MAGINKKQLAFLLAVFAAVLAAHAGYFMFSGDACEATGWSGYISEGKYFFGASYALSVSFMMFAFVKLRENKRAALAAAAGGGAWAGLLWLLCFLAGCCGSPMLMVYLNILGISGLKIPGAAVFVITVLMTAVGYAWLLRKSRGSCCARPDCL